MIEPETEAELVEAVRAATGPLSIRGGGTRVAPVAGEVLSTARMKGVRLYEPGALTIVAGAGTPLAEIETLLAAEGQRLPFEPPDLRGLLATGGTPTIGGVVAANASGPRRIQAGAVRDSLIGVRFVDGEGTALKNGGRVMKNVTGYDLVKLMAGSHGTLGVLTEVAFKVQPVPSACAVLLIEGLDTLEAVAAMSAALASPYDVNGAAHTTGDASMTMIRIEGFENSVAHRSGALAERLSRFGTVEVETAPERIGTLWRGIRDVEMLHGAEGDIWRFSVKPSDAPGVIARLDAHRVVMDWGGGLIWALTADGQDARRAIAGVGGYATLVRTMPETRARLGTFHPEPAPLAAISAGLRKKFDPRGILNPGLMGPA